ncbi:ThuA domain-containing protein [Verrucomicrobiaceae bacterium N1E253]|uniref:ThuA domain-containing protein n=1 Tax=Oceaniferula marina TaxID=2748318 RepID=A0A851GIH3_9BACT|nr:ThuA domain-containing protein [Oceaniferula marina]NWK54927.1 ThuA domain-containing protein [Oceaniferula marina]
MAAVEKTPAANLDIQAPDAEWVGKIQKLAPTKARVKPEKKRKVLMCSLATGFCHKVIPHVKEVINVLSTTGAFEVVHTDDVQMFDAKSLKQFDAIVLNNTCTKRPERNLFIDALAKDSSLNKEQQLARAKELETALMNFVAEGKGLMAIHGAVVFMNKSDSFGDMLGASFVRHPKRQWITLSPVEPDHALLKAFRGEKFIHVDEPYLFNRAYEDKNFRPLLEMDVSKLDEGAKKIMKGDRRYVSWIKKHGKGRVFYVSPSHQPESYQSSRMLEFYLDGIQYVLGDLKVDDSVK